MYFTQVNYTVCELHLNTAIIKNTIQYKFWSLYEIK